MEIAHRMREATLHVERRCLVGSNVGAVRRRAARVHWRVDRKLSNILLAMLRSRTARLPPWLAAVSARIAEAARARRAA